jgi:hypothetical protein
MKSDFTQKNQDRKAYKNSTDPQKRTARRDRRACEGKFGHAVKADFNLLVIGTTGASKAA